MEDNEKIGRDLAMRRICASVRQYQVAKKLGIWPTTLSDYERGLRPISRELQLKIENAIAELATERRAEN